MPFVMKRSPLRQFALALLALAASCGFGARAGEPLLGAAQAQRDLGSAALVSEVRTAAPGSTFLVSFHLTLPEGWHTYWRFAGDSGGPPSLKWELPKGISAGEILYPAPVRIKLGRFVNFGYEREADFLVAITAPADAGPGTPLELAAKADWLVCSEDVCIPRTEYLSLSLAAAAPGSAPEPDEAWNKRIAKVVARLPRPAPFETSLSIRDGEIELYVHDKAFADSVKSGDVRDIAFFPYEDGIIKHAAAQTLATGAEGVALRVPAGYLFAQGKLPESLTGLLVLEHRSGAREAFEVTARRGASVAGLTPVIRGASLDANPSGILLAAALALAGGFLLNLMPCVFPVLSMKVLGFLSRAKETPGALRRHGWLYTTGVIATFFVLAAGLYFLRGGGAAVGWGYQLQSPVLVLLLAYLMFALALVLLDLLRIEPRIAGLGQSLVRRGGAAGDFFSGALVTIVATPCTAPFMGAALGYALAAPAWAGSAVFFALGLGLALPYLVLSHAPQLARILPKPGAWMVRLRRFLAIPMIASAVWLLWVLVQQAGYAGLGAAAGGLALITFAAWASRVGVAGVRAWAGRAAAALALIVPIAFVWLPSPAETSSRDPARTAGEDWLPYSRARLNAALDAGRPVFVDLTAAWCLTCKVNEWGALAAPRVKRALDEAEVIKLRGDWTNRDPEVTALLGEYGRIGVPLYLYFPKGETSAKILPQILTEADILEAVSR